MKVQISHHNQISSCVGSSGHGTHWVAAQGNIFASFATCLIISMSFKGHLTPTRDEFNANENLSMWKLIEQS
jgi:hypothetical protein